MTDLITADEAFRKWWDTNHDWAFHAGGLYEDHAHKSWLAGFDAAHDNAKAAQGLVVERAADMIEDNVRHAKELGREIWAMPDLRDLADPSGVEALAALRAERDEAKRLMEMRHREMLAADELMRKHQRRAEKAEAERDTLAASLAAAQTEVTALLALLKRCRPSVANMAYGWSEDDVLVQEVDAALAAHEQDVTSNVKEGTDV